MHKTRSRGGGFFRNAYMRTQYFGRQMDNFFRANGTKIRDVAMMVAPSWRPKTPLWPLPWASWARVPLHILSSVTVSIRPANLCNN